MVENKSFKKDLRVNQSKNNVRPIPNTLFIELITFIMNLLLN